MRRVACHAIEEYSQIGAGSVLPCGTSRSAVLGIYWELSKVDISLPVGTSCIANCWKMPSRFEASASEIIDRWEVNLPVEALYQVLCPEMRHKIDLYRRLSRMDDVSTIVSLRQEVIDRFGKIPTETERLFEIAQLGSMQRFGHSVHRS